MSRFLPYLKIGALGVIALGSAYFALNALRGRGSADALSLPASLREMLPSLPSLGRESDAVDIALREMTRVYSLHDRPPLGGQVEGRTEDERFFVVSLDLGPTRTAIVCVVEPDARDASRQLVHFALAGKDPTPAIVRDTAKQGAWKASCASPWVFYDGSSPSRANLAGVSPRAGELDRFSP